MRPCVTRTSGQLPLARKLVRDRPMFCHLVGMEPSGEGQMLIQAHRLKPIRQPVPIRRREKVLLRDILREQSRARDSKQNPTHSKR